MTSSDGLKSARFLSQASPKTMRGEFDTLEGAEAFMNLKHIIHNFVNTHQQLGGITPAEAAEIKLPLKRNKLLNLIKYVHRCCITKR